MVDVPLHYLNPSIRLRPSPATGTFAAFAKRRIRSGELISIWGGHVVGESWLDQLSCGEQVHAVQVEEGLYLISLPRGEGADFINHSCDPNAGLRDSVTLVAMRDIKAGEEVCFDYAMADSSPYDEFDCQCGSERCRGRITGNDWRSPVLWARYDGYFSPYLARRIERLRAGHAEGLNGRRSIKPPRTVMKLDSGTDSQRSLQSSRGSDSTICVG